MLVRKQMITDRDKEKGKRRNILKATKIFEMLQGRKRTVPSLVMPNSNRLMKMHLLQRASCCPVLIKDNFIQSRP